MPNVLQKRWYGYQTVWMFMLQLLLVIFVSFFNWILGLVCLCLVSVLTFSMLRAERQFRQELIRYVTDLNYRIKRVEGEAVSKLPFGLILYSEERTVEWHNQFVAGMYDKDSVVGQPLSELLPQLPLPSKDKKDAAGARTTAEVMVGERYYELTVDANERIIYLHDMTELAVLRRRYEDERAALGIVLLDNLDEATQGMDDQQRTALIARVATAITEWAKQYRVYLRRLSSERYLMILNQKSLDELEQSRFVILDEVREMTADLKVPITLSIGLAFGAERFSELGELAQSSLDMALGRGGDQAAVKAGQRLSFYGGKSGAIEKRTRVRARVIAHALRDLMQESDRVIIMGHRVPDLDVIGASIGVLKAADMYKVEAHIVLDGPNPAIERLMERIGKEETLLRRFISPEQAMHLMTEHTLLVLVDTHKASMTMEPRLVEEASRVVIVDHHRRGEEFVTDAVLVYLEPYASSACELVTELLQYIHEKVELSPLEATTLLAGITVDTKHFALHTGSRTFEAAAFLRRNGADTVMVQRLLKEDLQEYIAKADIIKHARMIHGHIALAVTEPNRKIPQMLIAQVADTLLNMTGVLASFVISERPDGLIGISARSLGNMNVQVVMERLGGGGHLTNAAVQLEGTQAEAEKKLLAVLDEIEKEEGLFE
ncbi:MULTISPECIES: DHH family phosphoesterase [Paenibacillus]|jgi:c-di-AMP phosphodiesterase-like protein|uniref:DHH family phosphoesterase n=1 Tax=Paenibacillus TaxID=44249 RepID=UPI00049143DB|nr:MULTISPECIES: DHH family phosphoesterase [Paenibacillus]MDU0330666.1 DHH family phosphoesterase [Paenibacillus sp. 3LSP]MEC2344368.1 DHH family phosphoesterase [Paenibacillus barengoltzii]SMF21165.1 c-di-AMP phosphodiesterase, consists of a GGDEF-like and DHH domains [Paenibacillus barengoltzii]